MWISSNAMNCFVFSKLKKMNSQLGL
uniref:Uncharacterized protein n=1 Tax=Vitis vinifera TaxID=29760 RepID=F6HXE9_VITVI